jgi:hypothetical protein
VRKKAKLRGTQAQDVPPSAVGLTPAIETPVSMAMMSDVGGMGITDHVCAVVSKAVICAGAVDSVGRK